MKADPGCTRDPPKIKTVEIWTSAAVLNRPSGKDRYVYCVMPTCCEQAHDFADTGGGVLMGRHKKMTSAPSAPQNPSTTPTAAPTGAASGGAGQRPDDLDSVRPRRMTVRMLPDGARQRYEKLVATTGIRVPEGPFRGQALVCAAMLQARTRFVSDDVDRKAVRVIAHLLYDDALEWQEVDERRALTKDSVNRWLVRQAKRVSGRSVKTYEQILNTVGRQMYPQQFPEARVISGSRKKGQRAVAPGTAAELYSVVPSLNPGSAQMLLWVLDLVTGAGLRSSEIKDLRGSDFTVVHLGLGRDVVVVRIVSRWGKPRRVPVIDPAKGHRLLTRAREVGSGAFLPLTADGQLDRNILNRVNAVLKEQGFPTVDALGLRNRWLVDLASSPGVPAAALLSLAGVSDLRVLADQVEQLPTYKPLDLAQLLIDAEAGTQAGVA